LLWHYL